MGVVLKVLCAQNAAIADPANTDFGVRVGINGEFGFVGGVFVSLPLVSKSLKWTNLAVQPGLFYSRSHVVEKEAWESKSNPTPNSNYIALPIFMKVHLANHQKLGRKNILPVSLLIGPGLAFNISSKKYDTADKEFFASVGLMSEYYNPNKFRGKMVTCLLFSIPIREMPDEILDVNFCFTMGWAF